MLSQDSGYEPMSFDLETGNYRERYVNAAVRIMHYIEEHFLLVGKYDAEAIANFIITTYCLEVFDYMPRLIIRGASNAGKSKLLSFLAQTCYHGFADADVTGPALFRLIEREHVTPLLDELQDYSKEQRETIRTIFKNGSAKGGHMTRSIKEDGADYEAITYSIYAPMAVVNQSGGLIDETESNRSITIRMVNAGRRRLPMRPDLAELEAIRTELYTLRMIRIARPDYCRLVERTFDSTVRELESRDEIFSDLTGESIAISNRTRDMAGTLLAIADLTETKGAMLEILRDQQEEAKAGENDGADGKTFRALLRCMAAPERMGGIRLYRSYYQAVERVSTREIAEAYNDLMMEDRDITASYQMVSTRSVTNRLVDLGFAVDPKRMRDNLSRLDRRGFDDVFLRNLGRFGTAEEQQLFGALVPSNSIPAKGN